MKTPELNVGSTKCKTRNTELGICARQASVAPFVRGTVRPDRYRLDVRMTRAP